MRTAAAKQMPRENTSADPAPDPPSPASSLLLRLPRNTRKQGTQARKKYIEIAVSRWFPFSDHQLMSSWSVASRSGSSTAKPNSRRMANATPPIGPAFSKIFTVITSVGICGSSRGVIVSPRRAGRAGACPDLSLRASTEAERPRRCENPPVHISRIPAPFPLIAVICGWACLVASVAIELIFEYRLNNIGRDDLIEFRSEGLVFVLPVL